ncbi:MAG: hypothetical protein H6895_01835 [Defluviimonas sp.]|nr:hypothetical protein [Defluviimonas sp.]
MPKSSRRRLQGNVGAYQDTYGWIAYRLGNMDEAVSCGAAEAMPAAAAVQYHYALALIGSNDGPRHFPPAPRCARTGRQTIR